MKRFNMGFSVRWSWLAALLCLLSMGGEVQCDCTEDNMQIEGGYYKLTKQLMAGSTLIYHCPEGYYPYPASTRLCQAIGTWNPAPKRFTRQRCRLVECPDPNVLEYGTIFPPQEKYFVNNETTYECYSGYTLRGSSTRVCLPNAKWNGATPVCSRDSGEHCADPGIPAGASRTGHIFGIGDTVKYSCKGKLFLVGSSQRECQENGQWTGNEPACYYKHTYDTPLEVAQAFGSAIKSTLTTLEPVDDIQEGRMIHISKDGILNIYIAVDISESIEKGHVNKSRDAIAKLISKIASFTVTPNYEIIFFSSEIYEVVNILDFLDGNVILKTIKDALENFNAEDKNTAGTNLDQVFKTFLQRMSFIQTRVGEEKFKEHRHVFIVFTDGAYNMGGSPLGTVRSIQDIVYMNHTNDGKQSREEYLDIYIFAIGNEIYDDELRLLTRGIGPKHYFTMKDFDNLNKTFDYMIDEKEVVGLCGLHKEYDQQTKNSKRQMYPWWAAVKVQYEGRVKTCIGSLVTSKFVLTAAHCLPFGKTPDEVTVEIDDGQPKVKKVVNFKIHPDYNVYAKVKDKVSEFYDYDVALIQLEEDVVISTDVRPICIPCTTETSNALKLVGDITCKDHEELLLNKPIEPLSFLTMIDGTVEEKHVHAKLRENRDECISHALEAEGIDTNNAEDAVTDNFLCTGGRAPYRDHIACTGDSGGAVFKNYEHRTIQVGTVSWGTKNLCSAGGKVESTDQSRDFHINLFKVVPFLKSVLGVKTTNYTALEFLKS